MRRRVLPVAIALGALTLGACSEEDREQLRNTVDSLAERAGSAVGEATNDVVELAVRNFATQQGEEQFRAAGNELDDAGLRCSATVADGIETVDVRCTGTTAAGGAAVLSGTTSEIPGASITELRGTFTGAVDGTEVFATEQLGG